MGVEMNRSHRDGPKPYKGSGKATMRGVALGDVFRRRSSELWEVIALCDQPQATLRNVKNGEQESFVIGSPLMRDEFPWGPMREIEE